MLIPVTLSLMDMYIYSKMSNFILYTCSFFYLSVLNKTAKTVYVYTLYIYNCIVKETDTKKKKSQVSIFINLLGPER